MTAKLNLRRAPKSWTGYMASDQTKTALPSAASIGIAALLGVFGLIFTVELPAIPMAHAQGTGIEIRGPIDDIPQLKDILPDFNTTVVPRSNPDDDEPPVIESTIVLEAHLTRDLKEPISNGVVWRVFTPPRTPRGTPNLVRTLNEPRPSFTLPPGTYYVNAAYGRANLTRRITVLERGKLREVFVLNAGGLRADVAISDGGKPVPQAVTINIYDDESDQAGQRAIIASGIKPGQIVRLNAGLYMLESRIGRANAFVKSEVSVEAGKLTVARILHQAASITFRLVRAPGGEALPGTRWAILAENGEIIRESMGALPSHVLAPGNYIVSAGVGGRSWRRRFTVTSGLNTNVEIVAQ